MGEGDLILKDTLALLQSSSATERHRAIGDIKHLFRHNENNRHLDRLPDKEWHNIFDGLFKCVSTERSAWLRSNRATTADNRLESFGQVLRIIVEAGVQRLRQKTTRALLDHIMQSLESPVGYCVPLGMNYLKALRALLEYQPHVEHLREKWLDVIDFCLKIVSEAIHPESQIIVPETTLSSRETPRSTQGSTSRRGQPDKSASSQRKSNLMPSNIEVEEIMLCLRELTRAPNAPLMSRARELLTSCLQYLTTFRNTTRAHADALGTINSVLTKTVVGSIDITCHAALQILPTVKDLWPKKDTQLKDELLTTLILLRQHMIKMIRADHERLGSIHELSQGIVDMLHQDYSKRLERDLLRIEDIDFVYRSDSRREQSLCLPNIQLRLGDKRSETAWTILVLIASLAISYDGSLVQHGGRPHEKTGAGKRAKQISYLEDFTRMTTLATSTSQISALQILSFMLHRIELNEEVLQSVIERLETLLVHNNPVVVSWAFIALSCCIPQKYASSRSIAPLWIRVWRIAFRVLSSASSGRAAAAIMTQLLQLDLVRFYDISPEAETLLSTPEVNGPPIISDAACALWETIARLKSLQNPERASETKERIIGWVFHTWSPSKFEDRDYVGSTVAVTAPDTILGILSCCLDGHLRSVTTVSYDIVGSLGQTWYRMFEDQKLLQYLLLEPPESLSHTQPSPPFEFTGKSGVHQPSLTRSDILLVEALELETERTLSKWKAIVNDHGQSISSEVLTMLATLCIVNDHVLAVARQGSQRSQKLQTHNSELTAIICQVFAHPDCDKAKTESLFGLVAKNLPDLEQLRSSELEDKFILAQNSFLLRFAGSMHRRDASVHTDRGLEASERSDLDDFFESQNGNTRSSSEPSRKARNELAMACDSSSVHACVVEHLEFLRMTYDRPEHENASFTVSESYIAHLESLSSTDLCLRRPFFSRCLVATLPITSENIERLLVHFASSFLEPYEYARHEVALLIVVSLLLSYADSWTNPDNTSLNEGATDVYGWLVTAALKSNLCSRIVERNIVELLFALLRSRGPEYTPLSSIPSVRTGLYGRLRESEIPVVWYVVENIHTLFDKYVLDQHETVFGELKDNLPGDETHDEGIALRLLAFASLGSRWHTLLRRCVYHIFEHASLVTSCLEHAATCFDRVSEALRLENSKELYKLFASQLLFSWLDQQTLERMPYGAFRYDSLRTFVLDRQEEVCAQVAMRGDEAGLDKLGKTLQIDHHELLQQCFARAVAYCCIWDAESKTSRSEAKLITWFGQDRYAESFRLHCPTILGIILSTFTISTVAKALNKRVANEDASDSQRDTARRAAERLSRMMAISSSDRDIGYDLQPAFNGVKLLERIDHISQQVRTEPKRLWTPQNYVYVTRMLLDRFHPSLGSLHACITVRRLRVVISLAGTLVTTGYPLEMTLHSLVPWMTDKQCADDALGIAQHLLHQGTAYLVQRLSFSTSLVLSLLISLRKFLGTSQDSTTQPSQHLATMEKADKFRTWLTNDWHKAYIAQYKSVKSEDIELQAFTTLINAASDSRAQSNAYQGTSESRLLREILEDQRSGRCLLRGQSFEVIMGLLCSDFAPPPARDHDILGSDRLSSAYFFEVWRSCSMPALSLNYRLWAARCLGRSYISNGQIDGLLQPLRHLHTTTIDGLSPASTSIANIVTEVVQLLQSSNLKYVSLAEGTIRSILSHNSLSEDHTQLKSLLPPEASRAIQLKIPHKSSKKARADTQSLAQALTHMPHIDPEIWYRNLTVALALHSPRERPWLASLQPLLQGVAGLPRKVLPYILHLVLLNDLSQTQDIRSQVSEACMKWLDRPSISTIPHTEAWLDIILYLRCQPRPDEKNIADREKWLNIDFIKAARAAESCERFSTALLLAESGRSVPERASRRSSAIVKTVVPDDLLLNVYEEIDDPDSFYGVQQKPSLSSVLKRLDYEGNGFKALLFRGSQMDSEMRRDHSVSPNNIQNLFGSLSALNMHSITRTLLANDQMQSKGNVTAEAAFRTATRLEQWDIQVPDHTKSEASTLYSIFQALNTSVDAVELRGRLNGCFADALQNIASIQHAQKSLQTWLRTLGVLSEIDDVVNSEQKTAVQDACANMSTKASWMLSAAAKDVMPILSSRDRLFSSLSRSQNLQSILKITPKDARQVEVANLLTSCRVSKQLGEVQEHLANATYLSDIVPSCKEVGLDVELQAQEQVADVLWNQGEHTMSVHLLQQLAADPKSSSSRDDVPRSSLFAKLGHHVAEARMENPQEIMENYLKPAIAELKGNYRGAVAGKVAHGLATFCDKQLQSTELLEEFRGVEKLRNRMQEEINAYKETLKNAKSGSGRSHTEAALRKANKWFKIENIEYERLVATRESFISQALENYLLALSACDDFDSDVLRFFSLWLEYAEHNNAMAAVSAQLDKVASHKFVLLMNQLTSRLQMDDSAFQRQLSALILRICVDHPYHTMHNIYSSTHPSNGKDDAAQPRQQAALQIADHLKTHKHARSTWVSIYRSSNIYLRLAQFPKKGEETLRMGKEYTIDMFSASKNLHEIKNQRVPPATANFPLRADADYSNVPRVVDFKNKMTVANGLSHPKIVTAIASDGQQYKQLFKGGNDDLRQDAIMEQVFEQVSKLLKNHTATRQRNLHIRTYKVLPLSATCGIIEFVQNTIPLSDYLQPAHERYYPKDLKWNACRNKIHEVANESAERRLKAFREVCDKSNPVLRFFFFERFTDPDEWFAKRLAYTRSTATISILGHILGLGDRHCHNILLDNESGEIVHIDLGVAFEAGRVLPIPEVVPFRLTRDIVDAMGINKTEGVFRRCCEFTMQALRQEADAIMTLLNVLRYDPLYNWSVSPLRAKRIQEREWSEKEGNENLAVPGAAALRQNSYGKKEDEGGEASRSLGVVEKKLSGGLSVEASVSELIQQAVDERNLAVLYGGWSAWA